MLERQNKAETVLQMIKDVRLMSSNKINQKNYRENIPKILI